MKLFLGQASVCNNGACYNRVTDRAILLLFADGSPMPDAGKCPILPSVTEVGTEKALTGHGLQVSALSFAGGRPGLFTSTFCPSLPVTLVYMSSSLQLFGPDIMPCHAVVTHTQGVVTVTPSAPQAEVYVNNQRVDDVTVLQPSMTVRFGKMYLFRFFEPIDEVGGPRQNMNIHLFSWRIFVKKDDSWGQRDDTSCCQRQTVPL